MVGGNYSKARDLIWTRADTLIWLDYSFPLVIARLFRRTVRRIVTQEDLWSTGNRETWQKQFLSRDSLFVWAVKTHGKYRHSITRRLAQPEYAHLKLIRFPSPRQTSHGSRQFRRNRAKCLYRDSERPIYREVMDIKQHGRLGSKSPQKRLASLKDMVSQSDPLTSEILLACLDDEASIIRLYAATQLIELFDGKYVRRLVPLLDDDIAREPADRQILTSHSTECLRRDSRIRGQHPCPNPRGLCEHSWCVSFRSSRQRPDLPAGRP